MTQPLAYSTPSTPREKTDWRWRQMILGIAIASGGAVISLGLFMSASCSPWKAMAFGWPVIGVLAALIAGVHCLFVVLTRRWDDRPRKQLWLCMTGVPSVLLVAWTLGANTDRARFRAFVVDPIPPSVVVEQVAGGWVDFDAEHWVVVFRISPADLEALVHAQSWEIRDRPVSQMPFDFMESYLGESIPVHKGMREYVRVPGARSLIYDPSTGRAYHVHVDY